MKRTLFSLLIGVALGALAVWFLVPRNETAKPAEKKPEEEKNGEARLIHTNDEIWVRVDKKTQEEIGLKTVPLEQRKGTRHTKAYGKALDPSPLAALSIEIATARVSLNASENEFRRLKSLHDQGQNISTHALEAAEAAWKRDEVAVESADLRLLTGWGKNLSELPDLPRFVRRLAALDAVLVRLDLPLGEFAGQIPSEARIALLSDESHAVPARILGPVSSVDAQSQGRGFLCLVETNGPAPGTVVVGWLSNATEPEELTIVPARAVVRHEGETFVYREAADALFVRSEVELERPEDAGWVIKTELKPGAKIVTVGAQQLLSEELKAQSAEE